MKQLKRVMVFALALGALCAAALLGACSSGEGYTPVEKTPQISSPTIASDGVLRVGVDTSRPPLAGSNSDHIIGLDVDIAAALADVLGLDVSIVDVASDPEGAIDDGSVDIVMGIDSSEAADYSFWMSNPYLPTAIAAFSLSQSATVPVAGTPNLKFAAQVSSKSAWAVTNEFGADALTATTNLADAFADLETKTVNYVAADAIIGEYTAHGRDIDVYAVALLSPLSGYCVGVASKNTELQEAITSALSTIVNGGVVNVIEKKWLGMSLDLANVPLTAGAQSNPTSTDDQDASQGTIGDVGANGVTGGADGANATNGTTATGGTTGGTTGDAAEGNGGTDGTGVAADNGGAGDTAAAQGAQD